MKSRIALSAGLLLVLLATGFAQETPEKRPTIEPNIADGQLVQKVEPVYPPMAKIAHVEGDVVLKAYISKDGSIESLRAISGHPILIQSAIDAVRQWKYKPYTVGEKPVAAETTITLHYHVPHDSDAPIPRKLRLSSGVAASNRISGKEPVYPFEAKRQHIQGDVLLRVIIDEKGNVADTQLISGEPILADAAVSAVKTWKYKPWMLNGEPITVEAPVTIKFHM